jgi:hypothetical protein
LKSLNDATAATRTPAMQTIDSPNAATATTGEMNDETMARGNARRSGGGSKRGMPGANAARPIAETARVAALILGSPEFQRQ